MSKFYLTTAIAYVNAPPHIGFALEVLQADIIARYRRLKGDQVWFLTGTDEHGLKLVRTAEKLGKKPEVFADENAKKFQDLKNILNLSNDVFIRTTDKARHWPGVAKLWEALVKSGDIYKKKYRGLYCMGHEAFIHESDLADGLCPDHQLKPEVIDEENYFFRLSKYQKRVEQLIENGELQILPETRKNEILSFIRQGLEDVSFSRPSEKLKWGIPVPGDPSQTIYVWADALVNYISAIGFGTNEENFKKWWPADIQFIGKDILRFHAAIWPAMLLSAGLSLPKRLFVHGFITSGGQKMSKTLGNVVDPVTLVKRYGVDAVRYYLLREISAHQDGDFTEEKFEARYNADLVNDLGNLVSRLATIGEGVKLSGSQEPIKKYQETWGAYITALDKFAINDALVVIWDLVRYLNNRIDKEKIWELKKEKPERFVAVLGDLVRGLIQVAWMMSPYLPGASDKILAALGLKENIEEGWSLSKIVFRRIEPIFPRLKKPIFK